MARKNRDLAGFGEVAFNNINKNINNNINDNINKSNIEQNNDDKVDFIDQLIEGTKKKSNNLVLVGVYLQKDVAQVLDELAKKGGRGAKSKIVNDALQQIFKEKGLI
ncbi:hypothetical protein HNQ85_003495 [Anoxybacillus calidus]|uniref:Uncharacterized protein n=1 Tax=[Anoxybacillus] calidus TaxID=575178 RepID=A0A7V9Z310_9BACL|nr:hypothetical protein [Anoxybacillus calidus]MBA2873157.1 hypothetical protein [Anoxybacillus calidus]